MNRLFRILTVLLGGFALTSGITSAAELGRQLYEVRSYLLGDNGDEAAIDAYLSEALLPALKRQNLGPIGVLSGAAQDESGVRQIVVVIPYANPSQMLASASTLASDETYNAAAKDYLARGPKEAPYVRVRSELLVAMDCWTEAKVPAGTLDNKERVYELRLYESPNERLGATKVDMFNAGEVPIFLDCKIQPIFIGQAVIGPQTPSLTYLTMYPSDEARLEAWKAFRAHPDWKVLSAEAKYEGTVSHIDKFIMVAKPYSEM